MWMCEDFRDFSLSLIHIFTNKFTFIIQRGITLSDNLILFFFGCQIFNTCLLYTSRCV